MLACLAVAWPGAWSLGLRGAAGGRGVLAETIPRVRACAHSDRSPRAQTLHRNAANLLKEHGPFSHIRKASAVPPKPPKVYAEGERPANAKAPTERVLYTDDFGEEFEVLPPSRPPSPPLPPSPFLP